MELEDAIRLLNLSTPLFKHLLIVHNMDTVRSMRCGKSLPASMMREKMNQGL